MRTMKFGVLLLMALSILATGCKKKPKAPELSAKSKTLIKKVWKYNREASNTDALTKAGKASGIKNLKDIKLKGDVKKGVDFLTAKTLWFTFQKKSGDLVYQVTTGKGLLQSKKTGYWKWNADESMITLFKAGTKEKTGGTNYAVKEMSDTKMVLQKEGSKTIEVYETKTKAKK